jgi:hypothetical protein
MKNKILPWDESGVNVLTMDESNSLNGDLERLYLEAEEYDFLKDKNPQVLPDCWEED